MRPIDADALGVGRCNPDVMLAQAYAAGWNGLLNIITAAPTIDPIKAVGGCYCRECKYIRKITGLYRACERHSMMIVQPNNFCSWGKLKEAQDDG